MKLRASRHKRDRPTAVWMRDARRRLGLTQQELADRVGKKRDNIAKYETGASNAPGEVVIAVEKLLKLDLHI